MPAKTVIQTRRDTAANWASANPTLAAGEIGLETDTKQTKIGDGTTAWNSLAYSGFSPRLRKSYWHGIGGRGANGGTQFSEAVIRVTQFYVGEPTTIDAVAVRIGTTGTGSTGAVLRIGIWDTDTSGMPKNLLLDAGTVDATQAAGTVLTITGLSLALKPGFYYAGGATQGGATTRPFFVSYDTPYVPITFASAGTGTPDGTAFDNSRQPNQVSVTGAFASTFTSTPGFGSGAPAVILRFT